MYTVWFQVRNDDFYPVTFVNPFRTARVVYDPIWNDVSIPFWTHLAFR